ncbi:MAG: DNA repair protein RadC [Candidatus Aminicenantes bacterium]|nr:DNA repair protein RadC [Candidatus Aminicenantes bacterium]MDH5705477.1 DNA repair protein RadC [Candidatus Aminicenantes bacterium]
MDKSRRGKDRSVRHRGGHRERLREKFLKGGLSAFLDYEVIELLLTLGTPRKDCKQQAKDALMKFRSLRGVLEAPADELLRIKGIGPHNIFGLRLIQDVSRRFLKERMMSKPYCHSSKEVFDYLYHSLRDVKKEQFKVLFLDAKNHILEGKTVFEGTVDTSAVYPREIVKEALKCDASSLIFVHNHPSGDPEPSASDREITRELVFAAAVMQLKVLDHIIIGNNCYFSFADEGLIEEYGIMFHDFNRRSHEERMQVGKILLQK